MNLLTGLSNGTHTLSIFFEDTNSDRGSDFISNGANNYNESFTVIPEPSQWMLLGVGAVLLNTTWRRGVTLLKSRQPARVPVR